MKMKRVTVTWEKSVKATVYVPADMEDDAVLDVARETAECIDREGWDAEWDTYVSRYEDIDVPDEECRMTIPMGRRWTVPVEGSRFRHDTAMVMDDARMAIVNPVDATWWIAATDTNAEKKP